MTVATTTLIEMDAEGHLTLPEEARRALQAEGKALLLARASDGEVTLQTIPAEDAWAYTPEHLQRVARALQEVREGKAFQLSPAELQRIVEEADRKNAVGE
jgi:bifunctional DNA-binding transcriptional regulator/antitoxin component of YhaV-PrlF toxin-antitoxin module